MLRNYLNFSKKKKLSKVFLTSAILFWAICLLDPCPRWFHHLHQALSAMLHSCQVWLPRRSGGHQFQAILDCPHGTSVTGPTTSRDTQKGGSTSGLHHHHHQTRRVLLIWLTLGISSLRGLSWNSFSMAAFSLGLNSAMPWKQPMLPQCCSRWGFQTNCMEWCGSSALY